MTYSVKVGCLVADPPWSYGDSLPGKGRGAVKHYDCLTTEDICRMVLPPLADDCWLFLWRVHTHQHEALAVGEAWGFGEPKSEIVWVKQTLDGKRVRMGMGHGFRMAHEVCLVFKRGKPERASKALPSVIEAPRLEHSRKPDAFYRHVDRFVGAVPRVELFARRQWPNWRCLGPEMPAE
jgi:N6-adenosine-specific RNA methylase IME4